MPVVTLTPDDLAPFADIDPVKAQAMIDDALAMAAVFAPCILTEDFLYDAAARAILRGAILRWHEAGSGAVQSQTAGPYSVTLDNRQERRGMFWPSEMDALRGLCQGAGEASGAFSIDTLRLVGNHLDICNLTWGALWCSCGTDLTAEQYPIFELHQYGWY